MNDLREPVVKVKVATPTCSGHAPCSHHKPGRQTIFLSGQILNNYSSVGHAVCWSTPLSWGSSHSKHTGGAVCPQHIICKNRQQPVGWFAGCQWNRKTRAHWLRQGFQFGHLNVVPWPWLVVARMGESQAEKGHSLLSKPSSPGKYCILYRSPVHTGLLHGLCRCCSHLATQLNFKAPSTLLGCS